MTSADAQSSRTALEELEATGAFRQIRPGVDEDEHSLEMHLPYIRHIFKGSAIESFHSDRS